MNRSAMSQALVISSIASSTTFLSLIAATHEKRGKTDSTQIIVIFAHPAPVTPYPATSSLRFLLPAYLSILLMIALLLPCYCIFLALSIGSKTVIELMEHV